MRFSWQGRGTDSADLEALQSDVMRFVAILGLCLAAIFSLVHTARVEREAPAAMGNEADVPPLHAPAPTSEPHPDSRAPQSIASAKLPKSKQDTPRALDVQVQEDPQPGFILEFASIGAMQALLRSGRVKLFARIDHQFWVRDTAGTFAETDPPGEYYPMAAETVPAGLRQALPVPGPPTWGVTLPVETIEKVRALMAVNPAGRLLIHAGGEVTLEPFQLN